MPWLLARMYSLCSQRMFGITLKRSTKRLADRRLAAQRAADWLRPPRQVEGGVLGEERDDALDNNSKTERLTAGSQLSQLH